MTILKQDLSFLKNNMKQVDAEMFTSKIRGVMDNHAPQKSRTVTDRTSSPRFSLESKAAKQARRRAERKWNKSGLEIDKQIYLYHKKQVRGIN
ncbi:ATP-dependent DNA helicase [Elysia marginata]|uniref:ATP-dependent DNA helicase n=1 Tax=Elysia marginata TaxID=1093978 RepID=A0AAV4JLB8_9GAST|nr:ATP-dependent DNA helicase [Elysia marginata]